jgi:hypothetical protein
MLGSTLSTDTPHPTRPETSQNEKSTVTVRPTPMGTQLTDEGENRARYHEHQVHLGLEIPVIAPGQSSRREVGDGPVEVSQRVAAPEDAIMCSCSTYPEESKAMSEPSSGPRPDMFPTVLVSRE